MRVCSDKADEKEVENDSWSPLFAFLDLLLYFLDIFQ